jgi:hypothetical protein
LDVRVIILGDRLIIRRKRDGGKGMRGFIREIRSCSGEWICDEICDWDKEILSLRRGKIDHEHQIFKMEKQVKITQLNE